MARGVSEGCFASLGWGGSGVFDSMRAVQTVALDAAGEPRFGSGYLLSADLVLTAAHVLHGAESVRVRFVDAPGRMREVRAETAFADARADVAVLRLSAAELRTLPPVAFGYPIGPADCETAGFPRFQLNDDHRAASTPSAVSAPESPYRYRDSHHASGICIPGANRYAGTLKLLVPAPAPDPEGHSPWEGMSGAAVFAGDALIAVVTEHHPRQGLGALTASRVDGWFRLLDADGLDRLRTLIGLPGSERNLMAAKTGATAPAVVAAPMSLPRDVVTYTDRDGELAELVAALEEAERLRPDAALPIQVVDGMAGVGKTTFAVHAAHVLADRFPDGQWFVRLHAHTPRTEAADPYQVLGALLTADGVTANLPDGPAREGLWRSRTAGRRMVVVLDDALNSAQVRPLLPSAPGTLVLVTSRRPLTGLLAEVRAVAFDLPGVPEACALFTGFAGRRDLRPDDPGVVQVVGLCGRLPLAIGIMGARLRHHRSWTVRDLIEEMTAYGPLPVLIGEDESVAVAFHLSYRDLNPAQQALFRALGASPGVDADVGAAAALADLDPFQAKRMLQDLEEHHLLIEPTRGRYRMHDLLREYARTLADADPGQAHTAADRLLAYYRRTVAAQRARGAEAELSWLRGERLNVLACLEYAAYQGRDEALIGLTADLAPLLLTEGPWAVAKTLHERAIAVIERRGGDRTALATALENLGRVQSMTGDYADAIGSLEPALATFEEVGDPIGQAAARNDLGRMRYKVGDYTGAARDFELALEQARENGDRSRQATVLHDWGRLRSKTDDRDGALRDQQRALELFRQVQDRAGETAALNELGLVWQDSDDAGAVRLLKSALQMALAGGDLIGHVDALHGLGVRTAGDDHDAAIAFLEKSLDLARQTGDRFGQAQALGSWGRVLRRAGDGEAAIRLLEQSVELARQTGHKFGEAVALEELGVCRVSVGRGAEAQAAAGDCLRQAIEVYQELGLAERVRRVAARLAELEAGES